MSVKEENMSKAELRKRFLSMREGLSFEYRNKIDIEIFSRLLCSEEYSKADLVLTYVSADNEPDTYGLINAAFANGKAVAVPKCTEKGKMEFYVIKSEDDLESGKFGIMEPVVSKCKKAEITEKTLCVVPGLSFDAEGYRLGRGGGYYDRFLESFKGVSAGVCYNSFLRLELPREKHDSRVDIIVTENFLRVLK